MSTRKTVSVVIPTFNCFENLERALQSLTWADEIIIVDMSSTDDTLLVATKYGAVIFKNVPVDGNFDKNRKLGMQHAKSDWIIKLDSDEEITSALAKEIMSFLGNDDNELNGIYFYNKIMVFGQEIKHGFVKRRSHELRMVRKGYWRYRPYKFHQQISVIGKTSFFKEKYIHYNFSDVSEFIRKTNKYTQLDAKIAATKKNLLVLDACIAPFKSFIKLYFIQMGFLDGLVGLEMAFLFAVYNLIEKVKIFEVKKI